MYSTYLGGSNVDLGRGIALDSSDNAYLTGYYRLIRLPRHPWAFQTVYRVVSANFNLWERLRHRGQPHRDGRLVYSTYLGGSDHYDWGWGIAVDSPGNAYVTGQTSLTDFPTMNPLQPRNRGGFSDAFVAKINSTGSALIYSTYLGGSGEDIGEGIAVDCGGNVYVTGFAGARFPTTAGAFQKSCKVARNGCGNAFISKLNPTGSALLYSTYLGGSGGVDGSFAIAVDSWEMLT